VTRVEDTEKDYAFIIHSLTVSVRRKMNARDYISPKHLLKVLTDEEISHVLTPSKHNCFIQIKDYTPLYEEAKRYAESLLLGDSYDT